MRTYIAFYTTPSASHAGFTWEGLYYLVRG